MQMEAHLQMEMVVETMVETKKIQKSSLTPQQQISST